MSKYNIVAHTFILFVLSTTAEYDEDTWSVEVPSWTLVEDNSFGVQPISYGSDLECNKCPVVADGGSTSNENTVALFYYKKFITHLFSRNKLQYDKAAAEYNRAVLFTLLPAQLEKLEQSNDPRDLDSVLTEIFRNTQPVPLQSGYVVAPEPFGIVALFKDIFKDLTQLLKISEVQFSLLVAAAILSAWFVHRCYGTGMVTLILGSFLVVGYFITYLECNKKLELEEMLDVLENEREPISEHHWYTPLMKIFGSSNPKNERQRHNIKKASKLKLAYCRPDHVLLLYLNELFLKQLELLLEKCSTTILSLRGNLPFPINYIAGLMLVGMMAYILKLTFKYVLSPKAWAHVLYRRSSKAQHSPRRPVPGEQQTLSNSGVAALEDDRISGDNLKLLLTVLKPPKTRNHSKKKATTQSLSSSGVQELPPQPPSTPSFAQPDQAARNSDNIKSDVEQNAQALKIINFDHIVGKTDTKILATDSETCDSSSGGDCSDSSINAGSYVKTPVAAKLCHCSKIGPSS